MSENGTDHDAILRVFDATDRLDKKLVAWKWDDGRPTISPDEHDEAERLITEAEERIDPDDYDHGTVVARIWMDGESVSQVEWDEPSTTGGDRP